MADLRDGVIPDLTGAEVDGFMAAAGGEPPVTYSLAEAKAGTGWPKRARLPAGRIGHRSRRQRLSTGRFTAPGGNRPCGLSMSHLLDLIDVVLPCTRHWQ